MADSWKTSRTRQIQRADVKAGRRLHETGPWDEAGNLRLPEWMAGWPLMPADWPVWYMWAVAGKETLEKRGGKHGQ